MNRHDARRAVRRLAEADLIALTEHAKKRAPDSGKFPLTRQQIKNCLIHGVITEGPTPDIKEPDGWKMRVTRTRDQEVHEVACVLIIEKKILVITSYEERRRRR